MKLIKLTAYSLLIFASIQLMTSCEPDAELKKVTEYSKTEIPMTGAKVVPTSVSTALGKLNVFYSKASKTLKYDFSWSGLSGNPTGIGLYGIVPTGYAVSPTTPIQTISTSGTTSTGTKSGTLLADEAIVKEQDILNGFYYVMIRTAAYPAGEIRAQVYFQ